MDSEPIAAILEHYGADLHRVSEHGWRPIRCPFHEDHTASASVNLAKGGFACHACGVKGSAISLIMDREGLGFADAVAYAETVLGGSIAGLCKPNVREAPRKRSKWRDSLFGGARD